MKSQPIRKCSYEKVLRIWALLQKLIAGKKKKLCRQMKKKMQEIKSCYLHNKAFACCTQEGEAFKISSICDEKNHSAKWKVALSFV